MATGNKVGYRRASMGQLTDVDTAQRNPLGQRCFDDNGNEYIYLTGVASTAAGDWVVYNNISTGSPWLTTRLVTGASLHGPVAVAMAAIVASDFGWYQIFGLTPATTNVATGSSDGLPLYASSTAGRATLTSAAGTLINGAVSIGNAASNAGTCFITYPFYAGQSTF